MSKTDLTLGSYSILSKQICSPILYWRGEGLSPCGRPLLRSTAPERLPSSRITFALRPVPIVDIMEMKDSPNPKNRKASSQKS